MVIMVVFKSAPMIGDCYSSFVLFLPNPLVSILVRATSEARRRDVKKAVRVDQTPINQINYSIKFLGRSEIRSVNVPKHHTFLLNPSSWHVPLGNKARGYLRQKGHFIDTWNLFWVDSKFVQSYLFICKLFVTLTKATIVPIAPTSLPVWLPHLVVLHHLKNLNFLACLTAQLWKWQNQPRALGTHQSMRRPLCSHLYHGCVDAGGAQ